MAEEDLLPDEAASPSGLMQKVQAWVGESKKRRLMIGAGLITLSVFTTIAWLVSSQAAAGPEPVKIEEALQALDMEDYDLAKSLVEQIQEQAIILPHEYGGPLFVLGALKSHRAEKQWSPERRTNEYYIASKYLNEARLIGFPEERYTQGIYLLGKSLIKSRQLTQGTYYLELALEEGSEDSADANILLAEAYFYNRSPDYQEAIKHLDQVISSSESTPSELDLAHWLRTESYLVLGKIKPAYESLNKISNSFDPARKALVTGKYHLNRLEQATKSGSAEPLKPIYDQITAALNEARRLDKLATAISAESAFLLAKAFELIGNVPEAMNAYGEIRRANHVSPAGAAASLAEANLLKRQGKYDLALNSYRRALDSLKNQSNFQSTLISIQELQKQFVRAQESLIDEKQFAIALQLNEHVFPLISHVSQTQTRAQAYEAWGDYLGKKEGDNLSLKKYKSQSKLRYRQAGQAYERLAEAKYASPEYVDTLWRAINSHYRGNGYTSSVRLLNRYLKEEPYRHEALALLRLGQSYLAHGDYPQAVENLEECLEFYPTDVSSYEARLVCAKAYRLLNDSENAEKLLRENLYLSSLTYKSPEWRDSLFELGRLLVNNKRYQEAIYVLEEATDRYPEEDQSLEGRYLIAESYRHAAQAPLERFYTTKHINKKEEARAEADRLFLKATEQYAIVEKKIKLLASGEELHRAMLRNCYVMRGECLFELERYEEASASYNFAGSLYQDDPFILETLVQSSQCWRRLQQIEKAHAKIELAKILLTRLPPEADFVNSTNRSREKWVDLLDRLSRY